MTAAREGLASGSSADEGSFSRRFVQECTRGEVVFREGEEGGEMYAVLSGLVSITRRGLDGVDATLTVLGKGEVFGEMGLVDTAPRSATATAVEDGTRLIVIDQAKFVYLVSQQPVFALNMMQVLSRRIRDLERRGAGAAGVPGGVR